MARRSQCSSAGDNPLDPNYLPPHYREEYRLAVDALIEEDLEGYYQFLQKADVVDFLSTPEIQYIQSSVQVPQQSSFPEQHFLEIGGDGSSDTYWPIHSDLDAPGLDLGWPQLHHFIGPTEVTTLVNPPEPDMPSIKEQARRLIKNARQVVAIVMDMFTDVDMFADILDAAMRNVAVYILLDEQNAHHFVNMVSNCRVNLHNIQLLRVRTVSGITYQCRSGKSFKGQMMDRFLLTDCRAVLSGNYSFMWSFEKLHRCMAHLFLGQLVSTFDEEFRILFAQSQPLVIETVAPMEEFSLVQKRQYPSERTMYRDPKKFQSLDTAHPDDWPRHSYNERTDMDWRMMPLKKQESLHGPADMYGKHTSQQSRMDPSFDQGPSRMPLMENLAFKRHSYAEGTHGRFSYPFLQQQGMPEPENQGRHFHRGQLPYPGPGPGKEADYSAYDKFWNQDFHPSDQYSDPGFPQEMEPPDNFDPVLNYLSSTRVGEFDQSSEKLPPAADLPFGSPHTRRLSLGNPTDQKQLIPEPNTDRKDPMVKRGLRNWRISSYLSAYDNPGDEGLPSAPINAPEPFEEPSNITQQTPGIDLPATKIPNVREFKVPAVPRASQMPSYAKITAREQPKKLHDEPTAAAAETKITPTPSDSSSTPEVEKIEEAEQKETKIVGLRREESFRRKYNAAVPRSSRLRSSLIFSSMEQQNTAQDAKMASGQLDEESDKNEAEQTKLPFVSPVLGQRRSTPREPFEWSRYIKSATFDNASSDPSKPDDGNSKPDDTDSPKDENSKNLSEVQESSKPPNVEQGNSSSSVPRLKAFEAELVKTDQPIQPSKSLLTTPAYVDMNDPDKRLMFFKELAAKRKAAEAEKGKDKAQMKPTTELEKDTTVKKKEPKEISEKRADTSTPEGSLGKKAAAEDAEKTVSTEACKSVSLSSDLNDKSDKHDSQVKTEPKSCKQEQTRVSVSSKKIELNTSQSATTLPVSAENEAHKSSPSEEPKLSNPAVKPRSLSQPPTPTGATPGTPTNATPASVPSLAQGTDGGESPCLNSTSEESSSLTPSSVELPPSAKSAALDSNTQNPESVQLETSISSPPLLSEQHTGSELSSSNPSDQSPSSDHTLPESGPQICPGPAPTPAETTSSHDTQANPSSALTSSKMSPNGQESVSSSTPESSQLTSSKTLSVDDAAHVESDHSSDACATGSEPNTSSLEFTTKTVSEESCAPTPSEKDVPGSENNSKAVGEDSEVSGSSKDVKAQADSTSPSLSTSSPESGLPNVSDLEIKSKSDQNETVTPTPSEADIPAETSSPIHPDLTPNASQSIQVTPPSELNLKESVTPSPAETVSCSSPLTKSLGSVLSPEAEQTLSALCSPPDTKSPQKHIAADLNETETSHPTELTPKVSTEPDLPCKTSDSVISETCTSEPPAPAEIASCSSPPTKSVGPVLSPEAEKTLSASHSPPDALPKQTVTDSNETPKLSSTETSNPTVPTSKVPTEPDPPSTTPESVTPETQPSEPLVPAENSNMDSQNEVNKESKMPDPSENETDTKATNEVNKAATKESVCNEKTNDQVKENNCTESPEITSDEVIPLSPQSKQQKSSQSRYQSSTANVLSSSNLRDDTKLLLEQISANNQSRNEAAKESPVTDDEKEDKADKNAKREKERGITALTRGQQKPAQEREKLLEKIQSMRKERKVYSRFEMAP